MNVVSIDVQGYKYEKHKRDIEFLTLKCLEIDCGIWLRLGNALSIPTVPQHRIKFCPVCKGQAVTGLDADANYWEALSKVYSIGPEYLKLIHSVWNPTEQPNFRTFVAEMLASTMNLVLNKAENKEDV